MMSPISSLLILLLLLVGQDTTQGASRDYIRHVHMNDNNEKQQADNGYDREQDERVLKPLPLSSSGSCECDVFVVGLGWAGIGALHQLNRFKSFKEGNFCFMGADKGFVVGGRANIARVVSGKRNNPLMKMVRRHFCKRRCDKKKNENKIEVDWQVVDWESAQAFREDGTAVPKKRKRKEERRYNKAFDCVTELDDVNPFPFTANDTAEDVLELCESTAIPKDETGFVGNYENALIHWDFELETLMPTNVASAVNFPLSAYIDFSEEDVFMPIEGDPGAWTDPSTANGARIAEAFIRDELGGAFNSDTLMFDTVVTKIDYTNNNGGCVVVTTNQGGTEANHTVKKVIFTGSAGVLNVYGDDMYKDYRMFDRMFEPAIYEEKMNALRKIFFVAGESGKYRRTMSDYKELMVQVSNKVMKYKYEDDSKKKNKDKTSVRKRLDYNFLFFETERSKRGHGVVWQNMEGDEGQFYDDSRTFIAEISPSVLAEDTTGMTDNLGDPYDQSKIEWMVENTIGKVMKLDRFDPQCHRVGPGSGFQFPFNRTITFSDPLPIDEIRKENKNVHCIYQMLDGSGPPYGFWEGSWSVLVSGDWTLEDDYFGTLKLPLQFDTKDDGDDADGDDSDDQNAVYLAGEHMCYQYLGYQQGGYISGLEEALNVIKDYGSSHFDAYTNSAHYRGYDEDDIAPDIDYRCDGKPLDDEVDEDEE